MRAGGFKEPINVYKSVITTNEYGEELSEFVLQCKTRANVLWSSGRRTLENDEIFFPNQFDIIIHRYVKIYDDTRIELQGKMYRVIEYHQEPEFNDQRVKIEIINE